MPSRFTFRWRVLLSQIGKAWPVGLLIGVIIADGLVCYAITGQPDDRVRYFGAVLEVAGLLLVAFGLRGLRKVFGRPSISQRLLRWLKENRHIMGKPKNITLSVEIGGRSLVGGEVRVEVDPGPHATIERRVELLEENFKRLRDRQRKSEHQAKEKLQNLVSNLALEREAREKADHENALRMEEVSVGGLHLEEVGLVWLLIGGLCTSIPEVIARLL